ncbi:hypothetical protein AB9K24_14535 [Meridianimaribacter flavus]
MREIVLKQHISIVSKVIFLIPFLFVSVVLSIFDSMFSFAIIIGVLLFVFNYDYLIKANFDSYIRFGFFNLRLVKLKRKIIQPEYISLFKQRYKTVMGFGFHTPFGEDKFEMYSIKFFNKEGNQTVFKSFNKAEVLTLGKDLSNMLNVELYNTLI